MDDELQKRVVRDFLTGSTLLFAVTLSVITVALDIAGIDYVSDRSWALITLTLIDFTPSGAFAKAKETLGRSLSDSELIRLYLRFWPIAMILVCAAKLTTSLEWPIKILFTTMLTLLPFGVEKMMRPKWEKEQRT